MKGTRLDNERLRNIILSDQPERDMDTIALWQTETTFPLLQEVLRQWDLVIAGSKPFIDNDIYQEAVNYLKRQPDSAYYAEGGTVGSVREFFKTHANLLNEQARAYLEQEILTDPALDTFDSQDENYQLVHGAINELSEAAKAQIEYHAPVDLDKPEVTEKTAEPEPEPAQEESERDTLQQELTGLQTALEFAEGTEADEIKELIAGIEVALEFLPEEKAQGGAMRNQHTILNELVWNKNEDGELISEYKNIKFTISQDEGKGLKKEHRLAVYNAKTGKHQTDNQTYTSIDDAKYGAASWAAIQEGVFKYAQGGFVGKGELVWNKVGTGAKLDFLHKNFTPEITPRTQEDISKRAYNFVPRNVKIKWEAEYANKDAGEYAKGGKFVSGKIIEATYRDADNYKYPVKFDLPENFKYKVGDDVPVSDLGIANKKWHTVVEDLTGTEWNSDRDHYNVEIGAIRKKQPTDTTVQDWGYAKGGHPARNLSRDRMFRSQQEWEKNLNRKTPAKRYKEDGGTMNDVSDGPNLTAAEKKDVKARLWYVEDKQGKAKFIANNSSDAYDYLKNELKGAGFVNLTFQPFELVDKITVDNIKDYATKTMAHGGSINEFEYNLASELLNAELENFDSNPAEYVKSLAWEVTPVKVKKIQGLKGKISPTQKDIETLAVIISATGLKNTEEIIEENEVADYVNNYVAGKLNEALKKTKPKKAAGGKAGRGKKHDYTVSPGKSFDLCISRALATDLLKHAPENITGECFIMCAEAAAEGKKWAKVDKKMLVQGQLPPKYKTFELWISGDITREQLQQSLTEFKP